MNMITTLSGKTYKHIDEFFMILTDGGLAPATDYDPIANNAVTLELDGKLILIQMTWSQQQQIYNKSEVVCAAAVLLHGTESLPLLRIKRAHFIAELEQMYTDYMTAHGPLLR